MKHDISSFATVTVNSVDINPMHSVATGTVHAWIHSIGTCAVYSLGIDTVHSVGTNMVRVDAVS